ncbi:hypothetical protein PLICRDRAFT_449709 [Plicaturopsis crispa FD-325 SS-3]|uniref:Uncharacterized protein n=1 Tax=Plicaturopsis crispa FD-325 SS-3 TaxID=944288 RepID=A0A0C9T5R1_PLICR|nr:hypothetical protein PLICRDRAFT_449709 [Plicaturopsis crispa FD-325 SS-3]
MFMRYRGGGVGHRVMRDWDRALGEENHVLDEPDEDNDIVMANPDGDEDEASNGNFSDPGPSEPEENDDDRGTEEEDEDEDDLEEDEEEEMGWPSWEEEGEADVDGLLGAEDGEEPYFDMIDAEGYGAL